VSASPTDRLLALLRADPDRLTKDLYATLFALAPETREMFPANMAEQRQVLFDTLELLLTGLGTEDEQDLIAFLAQLGRDHRRYGVTSAHYQAFTKALVWTIRDRVGPRPDPALRTVIVRLAGITAATMDGAARAEAEHLPAYWEATVLEHHRLTRDLALVRLQADAAVPYLPGQYVSVQVPQAPGQWRFLSPTIPADAHGLLEFQVRAVDGGQVSPRIVTGTGVGDRWRIGAPHGALEVDRQAGSDVLMIAGGSGIAPLRALILDMCNYGFNPRVHLFYGARHPGELVELATLWQISMTNPWLTVVPVAEDPEDPWWLRTDPELLRGGLHTLRTGTLAQVVGSYGSWSDRQVLVSGSPRMIRSTVRHLTRIGTPADNIAYDPY